MAQVTPVHPSLGTGTLLTANAASAGGDSVANPRGDVMIEVINGSGSSINATIAAQVLTRAPDGSFPSMTLGNLVVAVAAGTSRLIGPIPPAFNDGNGNVQITWSATTTVSFNAIRPTLN